jgi:Xaa-Pro aminopeptidase
MDLGAIHHGYCGDMTRVVCFGESDARQREVYRIVLEAQLAGIDAVRPGAKAHDIDTAVRAVFEKYGCLDRFLHGTGHGIGLAVHEAPYIKHGFDTTIEPGMVFSVEPGLYYPGWGGVRIEDLVVVTETGNENITKAPKKSLIEVQATPPRKRRGAAQKRPVAARKRAATPTRPAARGTRRTAGRPRPAARARKPGARGRRK